MTKLEQISWDAFKERNDQLFSLAKKLLKIVEDSSAHIERGFHGDIIDEAKQILTGDMEHVPEYEPQKMVDELFAMKIHEIKMIKCEGEGPTWMLLVTRVLNGWIYTPLTGNYSTSTFVPETPPTF